MKRISIIVSGKVQGVAYRATTEKFAKKMGITGFVKNQTDGTVYIEAQGTEEQLNILCEWCKYGPGIASVTSVISTEIPAQEESIFRVIKSV
jgi:acylphosphatase